MLASSRNALRVYVAAWSLATLIAILVAVLRRDRIRLFSRDYLRWLAAPWKLATVALALAGMLLLGPISGDPTWDVVTAGGMSTLTFATAPFALAVLARALRRTERARPAELYVAIVAWLFSASWLYDGWILLRDHAYPRAWWSNLMASTVLYLLAGALWGLEDGLGRWPTFGFAKPRWPDPAATSRKVAWAVLAIIVATAAMLSPFLWFAWKELRGR